MHRHHVGKAAQVHPRWAPEELRLRTPTSVVLDVTFEASVRSQLTWLNGTHLAFNCAMYDT